MKANAIPSHPISRMSRQKRKNKQRKTKGRLIISNKPSFGYYLLMIFPLLMFFLVDNSFDIFENQWRFDKETFLSVMALLLFFGVPIILFCSRREINLYEKKLIVRWPSFNKTREFSMGNLNKWEYIDFYVHNSGQQKSIGIWFENSRKISIHRLELNKFKQLLDFLEKVHGDKKKQRKSLGDRLFKWMRKQ